MASAVVNTLRHVTERKLAKLAEQRSQYEAKRAQILQDVEEQKTPIEKLETLLNGIKTHNVSIWGISDRPINISLVNLERFLAQARHDPSVSDALLQKWQEQVEHELEIESARYGFASLFGRLVTEWLEKPNNGNAATAGSEDGEVSWSDDGEVLWSDDGSEASSSTSFQEVGREEMHQQRKEWESYAFTERKTDQKAIDDYLRAAFDNTLKSKKLQDRPIRILQKSITSFDPIQLYSFNVESLKNCIRGVLKADIFAGKKRQALADLLSKPAVMKEMTDVMKMDLASIDDWDWKGPVPLAMRRHLNGKYRVYMDEEIHDALILQYIGANWAVHFKKCFTTFYHSGAWLTATGNGMSKKYRARREYFLGSNFVSARGSGRGRVRGRGGFSGSLRGRMRGVRSVRDARRKKYLEEYFMTQLPNTVQEGGRDYEENNTVQGWSETTAAVNQVPVSVKQSMLRLATTEMLLNTKLYGEFTILQSDFKWFGPSIPHDTIFAVLKYLGVTGKWLSFFRKFLQSPMVFASDGPTAEPVRRKRGMPMSHILSDALSEAILFCLDFMVNQRTGGANLYRFHDDLWFWGQEKTCIEAWATIEEFTAMMGLALNEEKTGAILVLDKDAEGGHASSGKLEREISPMLPKGNIKWGFLVLNPVERKWVIDKNKVEEHIEELRKQLGACRSIFAWVQAWNSYVTRFLSRNFGHPANCFGREHVEMVIETFKHIQRSLFGSDGDVSRDVTAFLKKELKERFGVDDIPDGFFYMPIALGGLELRNPFAPLLAIYNRSFRSSSERISRALETEEDEYATAKEWYENTEGSDAGWTVPSGFPAAWKPENPDDEPFFTFSEFTAFREETSAPLLEAYLNLMEVPPEDQVENTTVMNGVLDLPDLGPGEAAYGWSNSWDKMSPYWKWVVSLYDSELQRKVGGLSLCSKGLLPMGLVGLMREERVRWMG